VKLAEPEPPIFVIGSPRSGTSILTWCLGQHPNILPLEETSWFSRLALALQSCHEQGSARGERSQLSSMGIGHDQFFRAIGEAVNAMILRQRPIYEALSAERALLRDEPLDRRFLIACSSSDPKRRWVDGTPEYSLSVISLRTLFPEARFIHILRDVRDVVRSLLHFSPPPAGQPLVKTEEEAYEYWLRRVRGCVAAEQAFGSGVVLRVRYRDLVQTPEAVLRRCLEFSGECYAADCLAPLAVKINSSPVSTKPDPRSERTNEALRREARELFEELDSEEPAYTGSAELETELEEQFLRRAHYIAWAEVELRRRLEKERRESADQAVRNRRGIIPAPDADLSVTHEERARNPRDRSGSTT
jgi:Sulfotransferase family